MILVSINILRDNYSDSDSHGNEDEDTCKYYENKKMFLSLKETNCNFPVSQIIYVYYI